MATQTIKADNEIERMAAMAREAGMPRDQVERFTQAGYIPLPQMMAFHAAARLADWSGGPVEIGLGGSRGPGKSYASMAQVGLDDCQRVAGLKVLFLRKVMKSAAESMDDLTRQVFRYVPHSFTAQGVEFGNGSRILIGGYKDERDIDKSLGIEYDAIVQEESTQLTEDKDEKLRGSLRSTKPGWRPRRYHTTNADGVGLAWFKKKFVTPAREGRETLTRFFDVTFRNNPFLNVEYTDWLEGLKGPLGKAWRDADWDAFAGMAFPMWNYERHVVKPFDIPESWVKWRGVDEGFAAPFCCIWLTRNPDTKRLYAYREAYAAERTLIQQAQMIKDMTPPMEKIAITYADPAMWQRKNAQGRVFSSADEYASQGVTLTQADNNRISRKRKFDSILSDGLDGEPMLQVFENCTNLIEQVSTLPRDPNNPEDVDTNAEDHAYDAACYGLTNVPAQSRPEPKRQQVDLLAGGWR